MAEAHNPNFRVLTADGKDLTNLWRDRLLYLKILTHATHIMDAVEVQFDDTPPVLEQPDGGSAFKIYIGYDGALTFVGTWHFDELELSADPARTMLLTLSAYDGNHLLDGWIGIRLRLGALQWTITIDV